MEIRDEKVLKYQKNGLTQLQIAEKLGITRQRVQQFESRLGVSRKNIVKKRDFFSFTCNQCKKTEELVKMKHNLRRKYCSLTCTRLSRRVFLTPEQQKAKINQKNERDNERSLKYYYEVFKKLPDWRERVKRNNQRKKKI